MSEYISTCRRQVTTDVGEFMLEQRNIGFEPNDGKWVVTQLPGLFWSEIGVLYQRRPGAFLGVFDTLELAYKAAYEAERQPERVKMLSCVRA